MNAPFTAAFQGIFKARGYEMMRGVRGGPGPRPRDK
jgi:hypothetical protein